jgi:ribonuclease P protein subunit RPR2
LVKRKFRYRSRKENKQIASERISILFQMAQSVFNEEPELAQYYVNLAKNIGTRYKVKLPIELRRMNCKHCKSFIFPGINCRIRLQQRREPHVVITCFHCGGFMRIPLRNRETSLE